MMREVGWGNRSTVTANDDSLRWPPVHLLRIPASEIKGGEKNWNAEFFPHITLMMSFTGIESSSVDSADSPVYFEVYDYSI